MRYFLNSSPSCLVRTGLVLSALSICGAGNTWGQAVRTNPGFTSNSLAKIDDANAVGPVKLPFTLNFFGKLHDSVFVNDNGNITLDQAETEYLPYHMSASPREIIAPFFADVDTTNSNAITYGVDTVDGHKAFGVNYVNVGYFPGQSDKLDSFQVVLIDRSDTGPGNFDIEFNYGSLKWDVALSPGDDPRQLIAAVVGYSNAQGQLYEQTGSGFTGTFLDGSILSLAKATLNSTVPGRLVFPMRQAVTRSIVITSLTPPSSPGGGPGFPLTVDGSGFAAGMQVMWGSVALQTTFVSATRLTANVTADLLITPGGVSVTATISDFGVVTASNGVNFPVNLSIDHTSPANIIVAGPTFTLTLVGGDFLPSAVVYWNATALPTTVAGTNQLTARVDASLIAAPGNPVLTVKQGGAVSPGLPIPVSNPPPQISTLNPLSVPAGGPQFTVTVTGSNFLSSAQVFWNKTQQLTTTFVNSTTLTATVPASLLTTPETAGSITVSQTIAGITLTSNAFDLHIYLHISSLSPSSLTAGGPTFTLTVNGGDFLNFATVLWNGSQLPTQFINVNQLTATVNSSLIATLTPASVTVTQAGLISTPPMTFTPALPPFRIDSLSPASSPAGGPAFTLTIIGVGFNPTARVLWNGTALPGVQVVDATRLTASVGANLLLIPQSNASVTVAETVFGTAQTTPAFNFPIRLAISGLSPNSLPAGSAGFTLTVNGGDFLQTAQVIWNGAALNTTFVSVNQLTAPVSASLVASPARPSIIVTQGGVSSQPTPVQITLPITSLSPTSSPGGGPAFTLTVTGNGYNSTAQILWGGTPLVPTAFVNATTLTATVPHANLLNPGQVAISVVETSGGDQVSTTILPFAVNLQITSLSPNPVEQAIAGDPGFTLTVNGGDFLNSAVVNWNGTALPTTFVSVNRLTATVDVSRILAPANVPITVAQGGATSAGANLQVFTPVPSISSMTPNSVLERSPTITITLQGTNFRAGCGVIWTDGNVTTTLAASFNSGQLTATVPANLLITPSNPQVVVTHPTGSKSAGANFSILAVATTILFNYSGVPTDQVGLNLRLNGTTNTAYSVTVALSFAPNAAGVGTGYRDPALGFANNQVIVNGQPTMTFTIPAGTPNINQLSLPGIQPGTVAGTITLTTTRVVLIATGASLPLPAPVFLTISRAPPVIVSSSVQLTNVTSTGFTVELNGYSTSRDLTNAIFSFGAANGTQLDGSTSFTVALNSVGPGWFAGGTGQSNGSRFHLSVPFTFNGDVSALGSVSVSLQNSTGTSSPSSGGR